MRQVLFSVLFFGFGICLHAQDFRTQFNDFLKAKDTVSQKKVLAEWEKSKKGDVELYVAKFNYYFSNSKMEVLQFGNNPQGKEAFAVQDSTGKTVSYLYQGDNLGYNTTKVNLAKKTIDEAISNFPNRLDLRFGKIYMLGQLGDWKPFTDDIKKTIVHSDKIRNKWLWTDNKPLDDAQNFMLGSIQGYFNQLYETENDALLVNMQEISETVVKYYPNDVMNLSNLGALKLMKEDFDGALPLFLKAEKIAPDDTVVMNNIAYCYENKGEKQKAIAYLEKILGLSDAASRKNVQAKIDRLKASK
ncbi:tetratricopeptide repeat protein [Flavobacterium sp.]|uniref:tetratricopeptide repeat protein n=1 Tax=Flavobacterium sp. TaxID=239 RepID=UPI001207DA76|nr:tetratricopeptide repeat protein [Flavobacterium sp.]RZJ71120.1 MAG: tetratricopeptide repeat protein [Flavobacterium sp.]